MCSYIHRHTHRQTYTQTQTQTHRHIDTHTGACTSLEGFDFTERPLKITIEISDITQRTRTIRTDHLIVVVLEVFDFVEKGRVEAVELVL
jgi:hypothetical protein